MEKLIACCGLNCKSCDAWIATINDDNDLRASTAVKWGEMFNASQLTAGMINCTGCREPGVKFSHCHDCGIRSCVKSRGYETCGECADLKTCQIVAQILQYVPDALENLNSLN